ncbi:MAG: hypothetical protein V7K48_34565 [Nostoc sp.]|uniref:hypothetical protein n=1 Tax=Nostoc sp. TaxID=1180 RepID=UPI002FFAFD04
MSKVFQLLRVILQVKVKVVNNLTSLAVDIHMPPLLLATFFPTEGGEIPSQFSLLTKGDDW